MMSLPRALGSARGWLKYAVAQHAFGVVRQHDNVGIGSAASTAARTAAAALASSGVGHFLIEPQKADVIRS